MAGENKRPGLVASPSRGRLPPDNPANSPRSAHLTRDPSFPALGPDSNTPARHPDAPAPRPVTSCRSHENGRYPGHARARHRGDQAPPPLAKHRLLGKTWAAPGVSFALPRTRTRETIVFFFFFPPFLPPPPHTLECWRYFSVSCSLPRWKIAE